jgi:peptidoglycan/LPS O-acetylase OafA/YrhL
VAPRRDGTPAEVPAGRAPRFPLLDSVRAIAALSVVVFHAGFWSRVTETGSVAAPFLTRLDVGVTVFFVLSGFLLYRPFVRARLLGGPVPSAGAYGWRRALRIVPAFWVALTLISLWLPKPDTFEPSHAVVYYGFAQIYTDLALGGVGQAWTLCVEVTFYAMLPLWAALLRRLPGGVRTELLGLLALALAATAWNAGWAFSAGDPDHANTARALIWLPAYLDHFALGMALAVASVVAERDGTLPRAVAWVAHRPWLAWAGAAAAFLLVALGIGLSPQNRLDAPMDAWQTLGRHWLYAAVALGVVLPAAFGPPQEGAVRRVLGTRALLWVGLVSYGLYLWHNAVMEKVGTGDGSWGDFSVLLAAGLAGGLVTAAVSWYVLERPALRLKRLVPDRALPPRDPETHASLATR